MKKIKSDALFEVQGSAGALFEEPDLVRRTDFQSRAPRSGADFKAMAIARLVEAGAIIERTNFEIDELPVDAEVYGKNGRRFLVLARGTPEEQDRGALRRTDTVEKMGFMAMQLARRQSAPILVITSDLPKRSTKAGRYLAGLSEDVWDVVSYRADLRGFHRLGTHLHGAVSAGLPDAPWRMPEQSPQGPLFDRVATEQPQPGDDVRVPPARR
jgi:hypothetical protein